MATLEESQAILRRLSPTLAKVDEAIAAAVAVADPSRVFLFGSWTRGEARWDSDVDMAVLVPDSAEVELGRIRKDLRRKLDEIPMTIDLILATESYAQGLASSVNSIFHTVFKQGRLAYGHFEDAGSRSPAA